MITHWTVQAAAAAAAVSATKLLRSCEHCKNRVEEAVNDIHGLAARVDLKKGIMTVSYAAETEDELIRQKVERAGYNLRSL